jgi:predicted membrane protein (TIGR00267 family)
MKVRDWLVTPAVRLDIVAGIVDGVLTALTLTASKMLSGAGAIDLGLAVRVSIAAGLTTVFVFFLAHYAQLRSDLIRAERQLNVLRHGRLAKTNLGRQVLIESLAGASLAAVCSVVGAFTPMFLVINTPGPPWIGYLVTIAILAGLGLALARSFNGSLIAWAVALVVIGLGLTGVGTFLRIAQ